MFNKLYEWLGTGIANLRNGAPVSQQRNAGGADDRHAARKRTFSCVEDGPAPLAKRSRMEDFMDTVKFAAEGVKNQGSSVASWVRNNMMSPSLSNVLTSTPASNLPAPLSSRDLSPSPAVSTWTDNNEFRFKTPGSLVEGATKVSPSLVWKVSSKSDSSKTEKSLTGSKSCMRQACTEPPHNETPKTNGHSVNLPPPKSPVSCSCPRLGRSLHIGARKSISQQYSAGDGAGNPNFTSMYEKTFPIRVVQGPSGIRSPFLRRKRPLCTAQESVREEEKEVYRQLLTMVSGGQCPLIRHGNSCAPLRSHRDLTSFLTSRRRLLKHKSSIEFGQGELLEDISASPSPQRENSFSSSNVPSPGEGSSEAETHTWTLLSDLGSGNPLTFPSGPNPASLQDTSSQDTQSSAQDGDSVIFVKEQQGNKCDSSSVPCFKAELWIKELTSLYDSRARERRRLIEEQEALTAQLLRQRLSDESHLNQGGVELQVRVPLEKEVPLALIVEEIKPVLEEEFPELTDAMEMEVNNALRRGNPDDVLSKGFRLTITRKDLQTLSDLNWLNDEVINFYMNLLVERSQRPDLPSVYTFNTFFFPKLRSAGFSAVRRWTKNVDIFSSDILLVPVHRGVHWCLSVVDFRKKSITYFDSMGGTNDEACRILLKYLEQESSDKKGKELDVSHWVLQSKKRSEIPQQMNGSDCGMFTCKYAEYITKDRPITFTQRHMPYFRRRMVWEILNRKLL
ncbi:sentrin-specific protease 1-like isoform X2 [Arapaima gigas]